VGPAQTALRRRHCGMRLEQWTLSSVSTPPRQSRLPQQVASAIPAPSADYQQIISRLSADYQQIISRLSADGLGNQHGVEGGAAEELVAAHKQVEPVLTEDVVLTEAANLNVVFGRGRQRHRVQV